MNISEVEKITGISKQTIRFYEKEGLVSPKRNAENQYREYDEQDIRQLKQIYVLRKIGLSVLEIKQVLTQELSMADAVNARRLQLLAEKDEQEKLLKLCDELKIQTLDYMDADMYIEKIKKEDKKKTGLRKLYEEYIQIYQAEEKKEFAIIPNGMIFSASDFTKELLKYADDNGADISITKEGMSPEFVLNGVEYTAVYMAGGFGYTIFCSMKYPEQAEPSNVKGQKKRIMKLVAKIGALAWVALLFLMLWLTDRGGNPALTIIILISFGVVLVTVLVPYWKMKK